MKRLCLLLLATAWVHVAFCQPSIAVLEQPYITVKNGLQMLDFDFIVTGPGKGKYFLDKITLNVTHHGKTIQRYKIEDEGMVSPFSMFPNTKLKRSKQISIFNPFYLFPSNTPLEELIYEFTFTHSKGTKTVSTKVQPKEFEQKTSLQIPLSGTVIIDSGYDHYAHHRRINTAHWGMRLLKIRNNITRYAIDFMPATAAGVVLHNDGSSLTDYPGFGQEVLATADGTVVEVATGFPDNEVNEGPPYGFFKFLKNPKLASGNYILLDHGNGEMSLFAHLQKGSVKVKLGQHIRAGESIGRIGNSGDSTYPHLHYQLENEHSLNAVTFPPTFSGIMTINGQEVTAPQFCNTGDLIKTSK